MNHKAEGPAKQLCNIETAGASSFRHVFCHVVVAAREAADGAGYETGSECCHVEAYFKPRPR